MSQSFIANSGLTLPHKRFCPAISISKLVVCWFLLPLIISDGVIVAVLVAVIARMGKRYQRIKQQLRVR